MALILIADSAGQVGLPHAEEHQPAQDYATTHYSGHGLVAVVSDGCSHGEIPEDDLRHKLGITFRTDVGARLIAHATINAVKKLLPTLAASSDMRQQLRHEIHQAQMRTMRGAIKNLGLDEGDLTATWLCAVVLPDGRYEIMGEGDGAYAVRSSTSFQLVNYDWLKAPFYPVFHLSNWANVQSAFGGPEAPALRITCSGDIEATAELSFADAIARGLGESGTLQPGEDILLVTDGVHQFYQKATNARLTAQEVLTNLGSWMDKRGNRKARSAMTISMRRYSKEEWRVLDDFTIASISALKPKEADTEDTP